MPGGYGATSSALTRPTRLRQRDRLGAAKNACRGGIAAHGLDAVRRRADDRPGRRRGAARPTSASAVGEPVEGSRGCRRARPRRRSRRGRRTRPAARRRAGPARRRCRRRRCPAARTVELERVDGGAVEDGEAARPRSRSRAAARRRRWPRRAAPRRRARAAPGRRRCWPGSRRPGWSVAVASTPASSRAGVDALGAGEHQRGLAPGRAASCARWSPSRPRRAGARGGAGRGGSRSAPPTPRRPPAARRARARRRPVRRRRRPCRRTTGRRRTPPWRRDAPASAAAHRSRARRPAAARSRRRPRGAPRPGSSPASTRPSSSERCRVRLTTTRVAVAGDGERDGLVGVGGAAGREAADVGAPQPRRPRLGVGEHAGR